MCGIAGALDLRGRAPDLEVVRRMCAALSHRGPDGEGLLARGPVVLGHRRLAIIDLSERAAQPMELPGAGLLISYNGEVYDHPEVRAELEQGGVRFHTASDTEVLLRAYERWGLDCFARLNGMWALALWDEPRRRLVLCRDRFGKKPLYLRETDGLLLFASEVKALLVADPTARQVDQAVLGRFLLDGVQDDRARTFFAPVRQLLPGHLLVIDLDSGRREERPWWRLDPEAARERRNGLDPARALRELLEDAVRLRLRSDVPVGTCLSGGLDSSSIVGLAARWTPHAVRTFTAVHDDPGYDERRFARSVVARFGCEPHEITPAPGRDLVPLLDRIGWFHDEPCARPGLITQWSVMSLARGKVKVLLDGQGGDELLLGYAYYALPYLRSLLGDAWRGGWSDRLKLWRDARALLASPSTSSGGTGALAAHLLRAGLRRLRRGERVRHDPGLVAAAATLAPERHPAPPGTAPIDRLLRDDLTRASIPALLHHEDRTSMAFSIEARVPFLDWRVAELALSIDYREKVDGGLLKSVLRRAMADLLPAEVLARPDKLGYPTPIGRWLREGGPAVREALLDGFAPRGLVRAGDVERAWTAFERGGGDPWRLYRWLTTELWLARMIERPPSTRPPEAG